MGRQILQVIGDRNDCDVAGVWARRSGNSGKLGNISTNANLADLLASADIAVDFTLPAATDEILNAAVAVDIPLVCGVSGLSEPQLAHLRDAASRIPILYDRNMSFGIALLTDLVRRAAKSLGSEFSAEIHETHHVHKKDAPSGTALLLGEALADGRGESFDDVYHYDGASDKTDDQHAPPVGAIEFKVTRKGEVPGDHTVVFSTASERVSLAHSVADRRVFAQGAVIAALWLKSRRPGQYRMADILAT